jgi:hypothetical protein
MLSVNVVVNYGNFEVTKFLEVQGSNHIGGALFVDGNSSLNSSNTIAGDLHVGGTVYLNAGFISRGSCAMDGNALDMQGGNFTASGNNNLNGFTLQGGANFNGEDASGIAAATADNFVCTTSGHYAGSGSGLTNLAIQGVNIPSIQAGQTNVSSITAVIVHMPVAMPSTNYSVSVIGEGATIATPFVTAKTTTTFTVNATAYTGRIDWSAIQMGSFP